MTDVERDMEKFIEAANAMWAEMERWYIDCFRPTIIALHEDLSVAGVDFDEFLSDEEE